MKKIIPVFKDDKDKLITLAMIVSSIFFVFVPSLIVIFIPKEYISDTTYTVSKAFFNFELLLFLISLLLLIPIVGWLAAIFVAPILAIINFIVIIINLCALAKNKEFKIPVPYEFI
jgi:uncharacterized membrane protein